MPCTPFIAAFLPWLSNMFNPVRFFFGNPDKVINGSWHGYYEQFGRKCRLKLEIRQRRNRFTGWMTDLDPVSILPLEKYFAHLPDVDVLKLDAEIRACFPGNLRGIIEHYSVLPTTACLKGRIRDDELLFTKRYVGFLEQAYVLDEFHLPLAPERCPPITYFGKFSPDPNTIRGTWEIVEAEREVERTDAVRGPFLLTRDGD